MIKVVKMLADWNDRTLHDIINECEIVDIISYNSMSFSTSSAEHNFIRHGSNWDNDYVYVLIDKVKMCDYHYTRDDVIHQLNWYKGEDYFQFRNNLERFIKLRERKLERILK